MAQKKRDVIGGVDTHQDIHVAAAVDVRGELLGSDAFPATVPGYRALLRWLDEYGNVVAVGVEGVGTYGAGLWQHLQSRGVHTVEVNRPNRQLRRRRGKSDPIDAEAAARAVLGGQATGLPKSANGAVEAIRFLRVAHRGALKARTQAGAQLRAVLTTTPEPVRTSLRRLTARKLAIRAARFRAAPPATPSGAAKMALASIARRWLALDAELEVLKAELRVLVEATAPTLVGKRGVGADTAGALLVAAGDNPGRLRSEAAFAAMCGVSLVEASSGKVVRHRLNRGGNRSANSALWRIVLVRLRSDPRTRAYYDRRSAEGLTSREIMRCLKRYVAREVYGAITADLMEPRGIPSGVHPLDGYRPPATAAA